MTIADLREVEVMLGLPGWAVLRGQLANRLIYLTRLLIQPEVTRGETAPSDDYIRGEIHALRSVLDKPIDLLEQLRDSIADAEARHSDSERETLALALGMARGGFPGVIGQPDDEERN